MKSKILLPQLSMFLAREETEILAAANVSSLHPWLMLLTLEITFNTCSSQL